MKTILITGGAGYIGSFTAHELIRRGYNLIVVDNLSNGFKDSLMFDNMIDNSEISNLKMYFYQMDVRDQEGLRTIFKKHHISAVIHLAGLAIVEESFKREEEYFDHNVNGTLSVLEVCREFQVKNMIFSSSSTIYGNANGFEKLTENHQILPVNPYGHSKILCEQKIKEFAPWVNAIVLRYFNVAGASSDLKNGPRGKGSGRLIFNLMESSSNETEFIVNGADYPTIDGTCVRDYIHVEDIADIHVRAVEYLLGAPERVALVLNCGYGRGYSINEIIDAYKRFNNVDVRVQTGSRRQGDPAYLVGDSSELVRTLGWKSHFDDPLRAICKSTYKWGKLNHK